MKKRALIILTSIISCILVLFIALYIAWLCNYKKYEETGLPRLDVALDGKITSKEEYVDCEISISNTEKEYELVSAKAGIRGRGNTTWKYPKKPYRIKFQEKTSLFGEAKNKSWVLLAMYNDFSLSKDALAFKLGSSIGSNDYVPSYNYVDVYINGKYQGIYLLTEHINENQGRTSVEADISQSDTTVPFLVEIDEYIEEDGGIEGKDFFKIGNTKFSIKYPDTDKELTKAQFDYIKSYIQAVHNLISKKNVTLNELSQYIDIESFIDYYLVQELMIQTEVKYKSVYMSKTIDGKLKMGPLWDYDWALEGPSLLRWFTYKAPFEDYSSKGSWFYTLLTGSSEFKKAVKTRFGEIEDNIRNATLEFEENSDYILRGARRNWLRWYWYNPWAGYKGSFEKTIETLKARIEWLDNQINNY